jgi:hypothetical protein
LINSASDDEANVSFRPSPNYAALAEAAAGAEESPVDQADDTEQWMKGIRARTVGDLRKALQEAKSRVAEKNRGMLIEVLIDR